MNKYHQLTQEERYRMTALLRIGCSQAEVARELGRAPSTICRELTRNATTHDGFYRAQKAHSYATARRKRERRKSWFSVAQWQEVEARLKEAWSPEQISGTLREQGKWSISHETIYRHILANKKAGGALYTHTRIMSKYGRKRYKSRDSRGVLAGKRHISERPEEVEHRQTPGHWEGDTVIGQDKRHSLLTLLERRSGYAVIKKIAARTCAEVTAAALQAIREHADRFQTLTLDNGTEFHDYKQIEAHSAVTCYFATPYHSWERGSNENLNGLIRQYLPKGVCMKSVTQAQCDLIALALNTRPRKRLQYKTPMEVYYAS